MGETELAYPQLTLWRDVSTLFTVN